MTIEADAEWRTTLEDSLAGWRAQLRAKRLELRTQERLFAIASASALRAGKYHPKNEQGRQIDGHAAAKADIEHKVFVLTLNVEQLEASIEDGEAELASLPVVTADDSATRIVSDAP